jgi:hypothetical protein
MYAAPDGSVYVAGSFDTDIALGRFNLTKSWAATATSGHHELPPRSMFVARFDAAGTPLWSSVIAKGARVKVGALFTGLDGGPCVLGRAVAPSDGTPWEGSSSRLSPGVTHPQAQDIVLSHPTIAQCFSTAGVLSREADVGKMDIYAARQHGDDLVLVARRRDPQTKEVVSFLTVLDNASLRTGPETVFYREPPYTDEIQPVGLPKQYHLWPGELKVDESCFTVNAHGSFIGIVKSMHEDRTDLVHRWPGGEVTTQPIVRRDSNLNFMGSLDSIHTDADGNTVVGFHELERSSSTPSRQTTRVFIPVSANDERGAPILVNEPSVNRGWFPVEGSNLRFGDYNVATMLSR